MAEGGEYTSIADEPASPGRPGERQLSGESRGRQMSADSRSSRDGREEGPEASHSPDVAARETAREVRLDLTPSVDETGLPANAAPHRPQCHAWLIAAASLAAMLTVTGAVVLLCHTSVGSSPASAAFHKISNGTCHEHGLRVISDMETCEVAAAFLGLDDREAQRTPSHIVGPEGCYYLSRSLPVHVGSLWLNKNSGSKGLGASAARGLAREPICATPKADLPHGEVMPTKDSLKPSGPPVPESIMPEMTHDLPGLPGGIGGFLWGTTTTTTTTYTGTTTITKTTTRTTTKTTTTKTTTSSTTRTTTITPTTTSTFTTTYHSSPTMFCFSVMRVKSYEFNNVRAQLGLNTSIFACDDFMLFSDEVLTMKGGLPRPGLPYLTDVQGSPMVTTVLLRHDLTTKPKAGSLEGILNTQIFMQAWAQVNEDGRFRHHDWTIKVDPDAVFLPSRLRTHLLDIAPASSSEKLYLVNCKQSFGLFGALEVFSREALETYIADYNMGEEARCLTELDWTMMGEDLFMKRCFDLLDIGAKSDFGLLSDGYCNDAPSPCYSGKVTFHPFKTSMSYAECFHEATIPSTTSTTTTTTSSTTTTGTTTFGVWTPTTWGGFLGWGGWGQTDNSAVSTSTAATETTTAWTYATIPPPMTFDDGSGSDESTTAAVPTWTPPKAPTAPPMTFDNDDATTRTWTTTEGAPTAPPMTFTNAPFAPPATPTPAPMPVPVWTPPTPAPWTPWGPPAPQAETTAAVSTTGYDQQLDPYPTSSVVDK